jgi:mannosyltransferase
MGVMGTGPVRARDGALRARAGWVFPACLLLLLGGALALRLSGLGSAPLWADEVATWVLAGLPVAEHLGPLAPVTPSPPGYQLLVGALWPAEGQTEATLRLPAAVAGALAVVPLALAARAAFGAPAGLIAAALCAVSASHIDYAQQARGHALLFLAASAGLWLLGPLLRPRAGRAARLAAALGFALACLVALHAHAAGVVAVAALFLHAVVVLGARGAWGPAEAGRPALALLALSALIVALGGAWWLGLALAMATEPGGEAVWTGRLGLVAAGWMLLDLLGGFHLGRLKPLAGLLVGGTLLLAAVLALRRRQPEALGLLAAFLFGAAALFAASQARPLVLDRTALPLMGFAAGTLRPRPAGLALTALLLALALRGTVARAEVFAREGFRDDWRGAVSALAARAAPGDLVVLTNPPDAGALPFYAPGLAERLRLRVVVRPATASGRRCWRSSPMPAPSRPLPSAARRPGCWRARRNGNRRRSPPGSSPGRRSAGSGR